MLVLGARLVFRGPPISEFNDVSQDEDKCQIKMKINAECQNQDEDKHHSAGRLEGWGGNMVRN